MATLDEVFAAMPDAPAGGTHEPLVIDPDTRRIEVPEIEKVFGVITDGNAEKKFFQCPRYVGKGIDLTACKLRIAYQNASNTEEGRDGYLVQDLTESGGYVYFSWELSEKVCLFQGTVKFAVCAMQGSAVVWNTTIATGTVLEGLTYNGEIVQTEMQDVIAQLIALVEAQSAAVEAVGAEQAKNVQAAGAAALVEINAAAANAATAIVCEAEGATIQVANASDRPLQALRIFGRSTQDDTPTPDNPVRIVSTPAPLVTVGGKNLCATDSVTLNGYAIDVPVFEGAVSLPCVLSWVQDFARSVGPAMISYVVDRETRYQSAGKTTGAQQLVITNGSTLTKITVLNKGEESGALTSIQLEPGDIATNFEPPKVVKTLAMANVLRGIPVASGGNYTDANGQQWICDEVDLDRGVRVQRVKRLWLPELKNWATWGVNSNVDGITGFYHLVDETIQANDVLCTIEISKIGIWGGRAVGACAFPNNIEPYIGISTRSDILADTSTPEAAIASFEALIAETDGEMLVCIEPIETALSEAELAGFAALHSVKPTTTILNDSGAHMAVEYVADTKLYIDGKLAELAAAMNA